MNAEPAQKKAAPRRYNSYDDFEKASFPKARKVESQSPPKTPAALVSSGVLSVMRRSLASGKS